MGPINRTYSRREVKGRVNNIIMPFQIGFSVNFNIKYSCCEINM